MQSEMPSLHTAGAYSLAPKLNQESISYHIFHIFTPIVDLLSTNLMRVSDAELWSGNQTHSDIFLPSKIAASVKSLLMEKNVSYTVMIDDVQRAIDIQNTVETDEDEFVGRKG